MNHINEDERRSGLSPLEVIIWNLEGVLYDLTHQFNPHDGGVCARTIQRTIKQLSELGGVSIHAEEARHTDA